MMVSIRKRRVLNKTYYCKTKDLGIGKPVSAEKKEASRARSVAVYRAAPELNKATARARYRADPIKQRAAS